MILKALVGILHLNQFTNNDWSNNLFNRALINYDNEASEETTAPTEVKNDGEIIKARLKKYSLNDETQNVKKETENVNNNVIFSGDD